MIRRMCRVLIGGPGSVFRTSGKHIRARARALIAGPKPFVYVKAAYTRESSRMQAESLQMLNPRARQANEKREPRHARQESRNMQDPLKYECSYTCEILARANTLPDDRLGMRTKLCNKETPMFLSKQPHFDAI